MRNFPTIKSLVDDLLEVSSSENPTKLKTGGEGDDVVKAGNADEKNGRGTVPDHEGGKTEVTAGRKYWKDVKGKVARVSATYYSKDDEGWHEVYWNDNEGSEAEEHLMKLSKPSGLPEAMPLGKGHTGNLTYRKNAFTGRYFVGTKDEEEPDEYEINPCVSIKPGTHTAVQSGMPESTKGTEWSKGFPKKLTRLAGGKNSKFKVNSTNATKPGTRSSVEDGLPEAAEHRPYGKKTSLLPDEDGVMTSKKSPTKPTFSKKYFGQKYKANPVAEDADPKERAAKFENFLANLSTQELENYINRYGLAFENVEGPEDWHVKMLKHYAAHHGVEWPAQQDMPESFEEGGMDASPESGDEESEGSDSEGGTTGSTTTADESWALLPDPGVKVVYEEIESLEVDEAKNPERALLNRQANRAWASKGSKMRLQNDTKCTLSPRKPKVGSAKEAALYDRKYSGR